MEKISVIVPVYNVDQYLEKCVDSILKQTYKNLEIILVDDGSTDSSGKLCDQLVLKDERIQVIHKQNGGLSDARNHALDIASGEYIAFVDSDDFILPGMYEDLLLQMKRDSAQVAICDFTYYEENSSKNFDDSKEIDIETEVMSGRDLQYLYFQGFRMASIVTVAWNKVYQREIFDNIRFPKGRIHEDEAVILQAVYGAKKISYRKKSYYCYRVRKDSITGKKFQVNRFQLFDAYLDRISFYRSKNENELVARTAFLYMHMLAKYQELSQGKNSELIRGYIKRLRDVLKHFSAFSQRQKLEYYLFSRMWPLYYQIWKCIKK